METPKTTSNKLTITIPLKETCGESMETAIEISGVHFNQIIPIETSIVHYLMDDMHWTKTEQSLIFANDKKYDKIGVVGLMDDGSTRSYDFWFDITECFYTNNKINWLLLYHYWVFTFNIIIKSGNGQ